MCERESYEFALKNLKDEMFCSVSLQVVENVILIRLPTNLPTFRKC